MDNDLKKLHNILVRIDRRGNGKKTISDREELDKLLSNQKQTNEKLRRMENLMKNINASLKTIQSTNKLIEKENDK